MINPLELTKKQVLILSAITVVVGLLGLASVVILASTVNDDYTYKADTPADSILVPSTYYPPAPQPTTPTIPTQDTPVAPKSKKPTTSAPIAQKPVDKPSVSPAQPEKTEPVDGGHIPFTNIEVTPGDALSYVGTVGQCPFYEMVGAKGCNPPSDIICNHDWTICKPR